MALEYAFELAASSIRFGRGVTREVGMDLAEMKAQRVMVLTDPNLARLQPVATVLESLRDNRISFSLFDRVRVEPTDVSFGDAIEFATQGRFDAFVAVGGGSTIDTAKAANLYATYPADFLDYVNAPIGKGRPAPGPLKPLIAVPTTAGTGSETTGEPIRRAQPCHRVLHGLAVPAPPAAGAPRPAPRLPGLEPDQRRVVAGGAALGVEVPRPGRRGSGRRRSSREDAAGGLVR